MNTFDMLLWSLCFCGPRWPLRSPSSGIHILCSPLLPSITVGPWDQWHREEVMVYHFPDYIRKDCVFCRGFPSLSDHPGESQLLCPEDIQTTREEAHVVRKGGLWTTASEKHRPANNNMNELRMDSPAPVKLWYDYSCLQHLDYSFRLWARTTQLSCSLFTAPWKLWEIINVCCFKLLDFGVICYTAIDN